MGLLLPEIVLAYRMASLNKFNDIDRSIVYEVNKTVFFFFIKHILNLKHTKQ